MPKTQRRYLASCTETLKCQHQNANWNHGNDGNNPSGEFGVRQKDDQDKVWRIPMFNNGVKAVRQGTWGQSSRVEERKRRWHGNPRHGGGSQGRGMSKRSKKIMTKNDQLSWSISRGGAETDQDGVRTQCTQHFKEEDGGKNVRNRTASNRL